MSPFRHWQILRVTCTLAVMSSLFSTGLLFYYTARFENKIAAMKNKILLSGCNERVNLSKQFMERHDAK